MSNLAFLSNSWSHLLGRPTICLLATHSLLGKFNFLFFLIKWNIRAACLDGSGHAASSVRKWLSGQHFLSFRLFKSNWNVCKSIEIYPQISLFVSLLASLCKLLTSLANQFFYFPKLFRNLCAWICSCFGDVPQILFCTCLAKPLDFRFKIEIDSTKLSPTKNFFILHIFRPRKAFVHL